MMNIEAVTEFAEEVVGIKNDLQMILFKSQLMNLLKLHPVRIGVSIAQVDALVVAFGMGWMAGRENGNLE